MNFIDKFIFIDKNYRNINSNYRQKFYLVNMLVIQIEIVRQNFRHKIISNINLNY